MFWSNFGVRRATVRLDLRYRKQTWSQGWEQKAARRVIQMIGAEIVAPETEFPWLQSWARGTVRKLVTLLLLALRKLPRTRPKKRNRKSYILLANAVPCSCPNLSPCGDLVGPSSSLRGDPNRVISTRDPNRVRWDPVDPPT